MPTYYQCGELYDNYPTDRDEYRDDYCESCGSCEMASEDRETDYDREEAESNGAGIDAATSAAQYVNSLAEYETPVMYSPNVTRLVSCEWEAASGVQTANYALAQLQNGHRFDYHGDVTCDGEIVFDRIALSDRDSAHRYGRSLAVLDKLRREGQVKVSFAAGHHVHVAARGSDGKGISATNLVSLYSVFAHCEDLLYRIAAAGWSAHRCENDGSYSGPMNKVPGDVARTARHVGNAIGGDRYQGLNVTPYLSNVQSCRCGAFRFGEWESCECNDNGATIEWRLWNGSVSARKIRTYCAISAVLTDYAANVDPRDVSHLEENPFTETSQVEEDSLALQLDYLLSRPGFSKRDRSDIRWLVSFSPGMGDLAKDYSAARQGIREGDIAPSFA